MHFVAALVLSRTFLGFYAGPPGLGFSELGCWPLFAVHVYTNDEQMCPLLKSQSIPYVHLKVEPNQYGYKINRLLMWRLISRLFDLE